MNIDTSCPFCLYALCSIVYDGRAYSTLERGNYLIVYKDDGSLIIHGADLCKPRNYLSAGSVVSIDGNTITSTNKKEKIIITIDEVVTYSSLHNWSNSKIALIKTEKELVDKIIKNWNSYFEEEFEWIKTEYQTAYGPIDIAGLSKSGVLYAVEVKRKKASISHGTQLKRYVDVLNDHCKNVIGILASPAIGDKTLAYLKKQGFRWLEVGFDLLEHELENGTSKQIDSTPLEQVVD